MTGRTKIQREVAIKRGNWETVIFRPVGCGRGRGRGCGNTITRESFGQSDRRKTVIFRQQILWDPPDAVAVAAIQTLENRFPEWLEIFRQQIVGTSDAIAAI